MTAWGCCTSGSLAKGDCNWLMMTRSIGSCTLMNCYHYYYFLSICKGLWAVSNHLGLLSIQSWCSMASGYCRLLIWESRDLPWRKNSGQSISVADLLLSLSQTSKHTWAGGGGGSLTTFSLASHLLSQKNIVPDLLKNLKAHKCWRDFIKRANINTILLKTGGFSLSQSSRVYTFFFSPSGVLFGPSNSGQGVWRVFCF